MKRLVIYTFLFATALSYFSCQNTDPASVDPAVQNAPGSKQTAPGSLRVTQYIIIPDDEVEGPPIMYRLPG
ncbi:MAG: hypothetical protein ABIO79_12360 [Ferruginibacter sp.]